MVIVIRKHLTKDVARRGSPALRAFPPVFARAWTIGCRSIELAVPPVADLAATIYVGR
jgi:hypothetical protein